MSYWSYLQRTLRGLRQANQPALIYNIHGQTIRDILHRPELMNVENQKFFTSNFAVKPGTLERNDICYEDKSLTQEVGKAQSLIRRDTMFGIYGETKGSYFVFQLLQNRSFTRSICKTTPPGRFHTVSCDDIICTTTGPCLSAAGQVHYHNVDR